MASIGKKGRISARRNGLGILPSLFCKIVEIIALVPLQNDQTPQSKRW